MVAGGLDPAEAEEGLEDGEEEEGEDTTTALVKFTLEGRGIKRGPQKHFRLIKAIVVWLNYNLFSVNCTKLQQDLGTMRTTMLMELWRQTQRQTRQLIQTPVSPTCLPTDAEDLGDAEQTRTPLWWTAWASQTTPLWVKMEQVWKSHLSGSVNLLDFFMRSQYWKRAYR